MPYNLFITRADGTTFKTLRSPYGSREEIIRTARVIVEGQIDPPPGETGPSFAERVAACPLGETVTHPTLGVSFRTERA